MHDVVALLQETEGEFKADASHLHVRLALPMNDEQLARFEANPLPEGPVRGFGLPIVLMSVVDAFAPGALTDLAGDIAGLEFIPTLADAPHDAAFQAGLEAAQEAMPEPSDADFSSVATFTLGAPHLFVDIAVNVEDGLASLEVFSQPGMQYMTVFDQASLAKLIQALQDAQSRLDAVPEDPRLGA
jgi:hypothetical protein